MEEKCVFVSLLTSTLSVKLSLCTYWWNLCFVFKRACVPVHPWGHGERRSCFDEPSEQFAIVAQLLAPVTNRAAENIQTRGGQVNTSNLFKHVGITAVVKYVFIQIIFQEPRTASSGWVIKLFLHPWNLFFFLSLPCYPRFGPCYCPVAPPCWGGHCCNLWI